MSLLRSHFFAGFRSLRPQWASLHTMGQKKLQIEEKSYSLTLLEKRRSVIAEAKELRLSRQAIYQLKPDGGAIVTRKGAKWSASSSASQGLICFCTVKRGFRSLSVFDVIFLC